MGWKIRSLPAWAHSLENQMMNFEGRGMHVSIGFECKMKMGARGDRHTPLIETWWACRFPFVLPELLTPVERPLFYRSFISIGAGVLIWGLSSNKNGHEREFHPYPNIDVIQIPSRFRLEQVFCRPLIHSYLHTCMYAWMDACVQMCAAETHRLICQSDHVFCSPPQNISNTDCHNEHCS